MMNVTIDELLRIRDSAAAVANPPGAFPSEAYDAACEKWDREVNAVPMRIEAICNELLMLRASVAAAMAALAVNTCAGFRAEPST